MTAASQSPLHPSRVGLEPLPLSDWLKPQPGDADLLAERARIIAAHGADVLAALPEADDAVAELAALLRRRGFAIEQTRGMFLALASIAHAVAEDLCILTTASNDTYRLTAGMLCFPNRWKLTEKIGGSVLAVHGPVPDYAGHMSEGVDRFLSRLKPERAYIRRNWGLSDSAELFLPAPTPPVDPRSSKSMYLRTEDQSFLKLPETGAVIFSIRTTVTPWADTPESLRKDLLSTIDGLSDAWLDYKSIRPRP